MEKARGLPRECPGPADPRPTGLREGRSLTAARAGGPCAKTPLRSFGTYNQHKQESHGGLPRPSNAFCSTCFAHFCALTFKTSSNALEYCDKEGPKTQDLWLSQFVLIVATRVEGLTPVVLLGWWRRVAMSSCMYCNPPTCGSLQRCHHHDNLLTLATLVAEKAFRARSPSWRISGRSEAPSIVLRSNRKTMLHRSL